MIELFHCSSPNVVKVLIMLEEAAIPYEVTPVDISTGQHLAPEFLQVSLNAKLPAIIDHDPAEAGPPICLFESGAILQYLAEKSGQFLPTDLRGRTETMQWLYWQMANLGPISGQCFHFRRYAPMIAPELDFTYPEERYANETNRLYGCLDARLADRPFIAGAQFTVADMASYPWIALAEGFGQDRADFPNLSAWFARVGERDGVQRAYARETRIAMAQKRLDPDSGRGRYPLDGILRNLFRKRADDVYRSQLPD